MSEVSPFIKSNPLYERMTSQPFAETNMSFAALADVLDLLFNATEFGSYFVNVIDMRDYSYPYSSANCYKVLGYTPGELKNFEFLSKKIKPDIFDNFTSSMATAVDYVFSLPIDQKRRTMVNVCFPILHGIQKEYVWVYQQAHMSFIDSNGSVVYMITLVNDVTELLGSKKQFAWSVVERMPDGSNVFRLGSDTKFNGNNAKKSSLSGREAEVLKLSSQGLKAKEVAKLLGISYQTTLTHKKNILRKTKSRNFSEAVSYALSLGHL